MQAGTTKMTRALVKALAAPKAAKGVTCAIDVAIDRDALPLSSFEARAVARNAAIMRGIEAIIGCIRAWETDHDTTIAVAVRAPEGMVVITAPRILIETIAALVEVAAVGVGRAVKVAGRR